MKRPIEKRIASLNAQKKRHEPAVVAAFVAFEPARYDDPKLRKFAAEQVEVKIDPKLSGVQAAVEAEMADGSTIAVRCDHPRGSAENPLTRAQIEAKFRTYAKGRLPAANVDAVIAAVTKLEEFGSTRKLMDLLRAGGEQRLRKSAAA